MDKKEGVRLNCNRCRYSWMYNGIKLKSKWIKRVSCPQCLTTVTIKEQELEQ